MDFPSYTGPAFFPPASGIAATVVPVEPAKQSWDHVANAKKGKGKGNGRGRGQLGGVVAGGVVVVGGQSPSSRACSCLSWLPGH